MSHVWDNDRTGNGWSVYSASLFGDASVRNKYRTGSDGAVKSSSLSSSVSVRNNSRTGHSFQIVITIWWCLIREQDVVEQWRHYSQDHGYEGSSPGQGRNLLPLRMTVFFLLVDDHWDANSRSLYQACLALQVARTPRSCSGSSDFLCYWESVREMILFVRVIYMPVTMSVIWGWTSGTWYYSHDNQRSFVLFFRLLSGCFAGQVYYTHCKQMC